MKFPTLENALESAAAAAAAADPFLLYRGFTV